VKKVNAFAHLPSPIVDFGHEELLLGRLGFENARVEVAISAVLGYNAMKVKHEIKIVKILDDVGRLVVVVLVDLFEHVNLSLDIILISVNHFQNSPF
jgi:hypothetical protein